MYVSIFPSIFILLALQHNEWCLIIHTSICISLFSPLKTLIILGEDLLNKCCTWLMTYDLCWLIGVPSSPVSGVWFFQHGFRSGTAGRPLAASTLQTRFLPCCKVDSTFGPQGDTVWCEKLCALCCPCLSMSNSLTKLQGRLVVSLPVALDCSSRLIWPARWNPCQAADVWPQDTRIPQQTSTQLPLSFETITSAFGLFSALRPSRLYFKNQSLIEDMNGRLSEAAKFIKTIKKFKSECMHVIMNLSPRATVWG